MINLFESIYFSYYQYNIFYFFARWLKPIKTHYVFYYYRAIHATLNKF